MITDLKPYPAYKDSGVEWLGEVPEGWEVLPARSLFDEVIERDHPEEELLSVTIKDGVVPQASLLEETSSKDGSNLDKSSYKLVQPGDIAYNKMRAWQGAAGCSSVRGLVSPAYIVMRSRGAIEPALAHRLLRTPAFAKEAERWSYGITSDQWSLRAKDFKQIYFPVPSGESQAAIVSLLDHIDARIRRLIATKERLIELLEEEKQAIIHRAVTRGLDPQVRLGPSGVEWLSRIPEHWDVVPLRFRYSVKLGKMLDAKRITGTSLMPYLRNTDVQWDRINTEDLPEMDIAPDERDRYTVRPGDLLVCEGGEVGRAAIWEQSQAMGYQKALHRLRPYRVSRDKPRFLYYLLRAAANLGIFKADGSESTIAHLTAEKLRRFRFPCPPGHEQDAIAKLLDRESERRESLAAISGAHIDLLREYRTRLISDVVTGKLDVREAAESLPDDPGVDDPALDERLEEAATA